jgi:CheY-like chemotaxis protein
VLRTWCLYAGIGFFPVLISQERWPGFTAYLFLDLVSISVSSGFLFSAREFWLWNGIGFTWAMLIPYLDLSARNHLLDIVIPLVGVQVCTTLTWMVLLRKTAALEAQNAAFQEAESRALMLARAKTQFIAAMSHEVRTPLNGLLGLIDVLAETQPLHEIQRELVKSVQGCAHVLLSLCTSALQYGRYITVDIASTAATSVASNVGFLARPAVDLVTQSARNVLPVACVSPRAFSLRALLDDAGLAAASAGALRGVAVHWSVAPNVTDSYYGNPELLMELALKMLDFSLSRVSDTSGRITIRVELAPVGDLATPTDHVSLRLAVIDNGPPISDGQLALGIQPLMPHPGSDGADLMSTNGDFELATAGIVARWLGGWLHFVCVPHDDPQSFMVLQGMVRLQLASPSCVASAARQAALMPDTLNTESLAKADAHALPWPLWSPGCDHSASVLTDARLALLCDFSDTARALRDIVESAGVRSPSEILLPGTEAGWQEREPPLDLLHYQGAHAFENVHVVLVELSPEVLMDVLPLLVRLPLPAATVETRSIVVRVPAAWLPAVERDLERLERAPAAQRQVVLVSASLPTCALIHVILRAWRHLPSSQSLRSEDLDHYRPCTDVCDIADMLSPVLPDLTDRFFDSENGLKVDHLSVGTAKFPPDMRVLVVEDNRINAMVLRRLLQKVGVSCDVVTNGIDALRKLQRASHVVLALDCTEQNTSVESFGDSAPTDRVRYWAVLMDLHMPGMDGLEATRRLRVLERDRGWTRVPVVAVTASIADETGPLCKAAGMDGFLSKPVTIRMLSSCLSSVCHDS